MHVRQTLILNSGTCMTRLDHWQELCKDVGIENVPESITQCRIVST